MTRAHWLRSLATVAHPERGPRPNRSATRYRPFRPMLEVLDDRVCLDASSPAGPSILQLAQGGIAYLTNPAQAFVSGQRLAQSFLARAGTNPEEHLAVDVALGTEVVGGAGLVSMFATAGAVGLQGGNLPLATLGIGGAVAGGATLLGVATVVAQDVAVVGPMVAADARGCDLFRPAARLGDQLRVPNVEREHLPSPSGRPARIDDER